MPLFRPAREPQFTFTIYKTEYRVVEFVANEHLSTPFKVVMRITTTGMVDTNEILGQIGLLEIEGKDKPRYFNGLVSYIRQAGVKGRFYLYDIFLEPLIALLELKKDIRIFQQQSTPDIVQSVLKENRITSDRFTLRLKEKYEKRAYCVQYRETDLHFISRLLAEEGIFYFFEHDKENHILVFGDSDIAYTPMDGGREVPFNSETSLMADEEFVSIFSLAHRIQSGKTTLKDFNFERPSLKLTAEDSIKDYKHLEIYDYPGVYTTPEKGKRCARVRLEEHTQFKTIGEGQSIVPRFAPGVICQLKDHPLKSMNQGYVVLEVIHKGSQPQALEEHTGNSDAVTYGNEFKVLSDQTIFRPDSSFEKPVVRGLQTAIVTGPEGEEIYVDKFGRVKVQFHWDRSGQYDEKSSCWIRVSQLAAGKGWGGLFTPRVGQEVVVDFLDGDPDRPLIIGSVYHGTHLPPYTLPEENTKSTIKSNSSPKGDGFNEIRLEDKKGEEQLFVHAEKNHDIRVKNDHLEWVGNDRHRIVEKIERVKIGGDRHLTIAGDFNQKIKGSISNQVLGDIQEKIHGRLGQEAGSEIHLKAGVKVILEAGSQITLKAGSNFIDIGPKGIHIQGTMLNLNSGGSPGKGSSVSTEAPLLPLEADNAKPGKTTIAPKAPDTLSPQALNLKKSAQKGRPFCKVCQMQ